MSLISFKFILFCIILLLCYFFLPKKCQWIVLLVFSLFFYFLSGINNSIYIIITAFSTWLSALWIEKVGQKTKIYIKENPTLDIEDKKIIKNKSKNKKKLILIGTLLLNFGILCLFKYANFAIEQINSLINIFGGEIKINSLSLIIPLGISFYTFQTMGYLVDVYWEKTDACKNPLKMLLFTSFFPQITQGPISNYNQLSTQLFSHHKFDYNNWVYGVQRMIWGFFKKIAIADLLSSYVNSVFLNYNEYAGVTVLIGIFFYSIQIYADFSGYMDIVCGFCQIMGIELTENFERPYFSKSIAEYWRRWHISLGNWFKIYIYYPIAVSKWNSNLGKKASQKFGKFVGKNLPASIALVVVWLTTGLWHGANWGYVVWGGLNGLFIIFSMWMEPVYNFIKAKLKLGGPIWKAVQVLRTFVLVTFIKVLPEAGGLRNGLGLWKQIFTEHSIPDSFKALLPFASKITLIIICFGTLLMLIISLIQRKGQVRNRLNNIPTIPRIFFLAVLVTITIIATLINNNTGGGFMYAQF